MTLVAFPCEPVRRITVGEYHRMIEAGILREDEPFELLEGSIVPKMTREPPHDAALSFLEDEIARLLPAGWFRRVQSAITTSDSEPEPDLAVVRGVRRDYARRHPAPKEVGLVVEVADATLERDRAFKARVYARTRIPVYWIVNLIDRRVELLTRPSGSGARARYLSRREYRPGEAVPLVLGGRRVGSVRVDDILP